MRSERKSLDVELESGHNNINLIDMTNFTGIAVQIKGPIGGAGKIKVQVSNDANSWFDFTENAVDIAAGEGYIQEINIMACRARLHVNLSAGAGKYKIITMAKED